MALNLDNFEIALDDQEEHLGRRPLATIGAVSGKDVLLGVNGFNSEFAPGGQSETATQEIQCRASDFPDLDEQQLATVDGRALKVLTFKNNGGILEITVGDPTTELAY